MSLRSPIGRVLGLGAAKEGASHWWSQRVTSVALTLLTLWLTFQLVTLPDFDHATVIAWIAAPFNAVLLILLTATVAYHSQLGVQVVVEDYVVSAPVKIVTMLAITFTHVALAAVGIFAVLRIAFAGSIA